MFSFVKKLGLYHLEWDLLSLDAKAQLRRIAHGLVTLSFVDVDFRSLREAQDYILLAKSLSYLWIDSACVFYQDSTSMRPHLNVQQMGVDLTLLRNRSFLRWLLHSPFKILELLDIPFGFADIVADCRHWGPTLRRLRLSFIGMQSKQSILLSCTRNSFIFQALNVMLVNIHGSIY